MKKLAVWFLSASLGLMAASALQAAEVAAGDPAQRREKAEADFLRQQASVEALLDALLRAGQEKGQASSARATVKQAQALLQEGRELLQSGSAEEGRARLDQALALVRTSIAAMREGETLGQRNGDQAEVSSGAEQKAREDFERQKSSLDALMGALTSIAEEKRESAAQEVVAEARRMEAQALQLLERGQVVQGRALIDRAQLLVRTSIAALRGGETLIRSLEFASTEEEYRYESDRFATYEMLLDLLVAKKIEGQPQLARQVAEQRGVAVEMRIAAQKKADAGDFDAAVTELEAAARELLKAIRRGGIFVPG